ncbi:hypothetical protein EZS27_031525 [termite gut metagenome]|uniref:Uncharacterized protein n=1 Tax=termite gut metagenome TaxID=433724 RepID=A0A5J4QCN3_9ZZZZ
MINIVIAFDNQNAVLGQYFEDCQNDIATLLDEQSHLIKSFSKVPSPQCNVAYIDITISSLNTNPFVFIAYTHGVNDGLKCGGGSFVSTDNCQHFKNSLFYSTACLIGKELAPELINKGCKAFIGFNEKTTVIFENPSYRQIFMECDNFALKMFLTSDSSIGKAFNSMKNHYTNKIDRAIELGEDFVFTRFLRENRDALVCLGDKNLKKEDLFVPSS